jgi:Zn-dependent peptidase ImmA (M78 family)
MVKVDINADLLRWARERAGMTVGELLSKFPKLEQWEQGEAKPTLKQVEDYAKTTQTPFGYMFLDKPPNEPLPIPDFRTMQGRHIARPSPNLLEMIYACEQRQDWFRGYVRSNGWPELTFVGSMTPDTAVITAAREIRKALSFDLEARRNCSTWTEALRMFIGLADSLGILVMTSGIVMNNTHRKLNPKEFRGFALSDKVAPLVFVNGADSKSAQMFTLAHELAHIWLGQSAISDSTLDSSGGNRIETWCNRVAAEMLAPLAAVKSELVEGEALSVTVSRLTRMFKVSSLVILQRLRDVGAIPAADFDAVYKEELRRLDNLPKRSGGGDFYVSTVARYNRRFTRALLESTLEGRTLYRDAYRLLGISKTETFNELGRTLQFGV